MKDYIIKHEWKIIEDKYRPEYNQITESLLSLGNGKMGQRANYEESFSGTSLQGSYVAGVYYPDKTRVGWWKNGYPEYFAKVLNSCNWIGIRVVLGDEEVDLHQAKKVNHFYRELDMKSGYLMREMNITTAGGKGIKIKSIRFVSMHNDELGAISYAITSTNYNGPIAIKSYLDFDVVNQDRNYDEQFWESGKLENTPQYGYVSATTKKTDYHIGVAMTNTLYINDQKSDSSPALSQRDSYVEHDFTFEIKSGDSIKVEKLAYIASSMYYPTAKIMTAAIDGVTTAAQYDFDHHLTDHTNAWEKIWELCDVKIEGDVSAQQGIRFNIFQLYQTYTGKDHRLNIGPKGFTGEKYGGSTYWDTEAYCLPFYMSTADESVAKNLLEYRYNHLSKAIENAAKLGFEKGAALYPMVTMTGEECHNEWEITFEEIHRNGAIAYAIYDYIRYTGDKKYLVEYGLEVLIGIARFWAQRVNWSTQKERFVILGVTGPNEYENNINNNWYTNYIAAWCLDYARESIVWVKDNYPDEFKNIITKINLENNETEQWEHISAHMYYPKDETLDIFLQQDNYLDKEQMTVDELDAKHRPINQKWSWDRILRSCFIKQADVLQGMYFFEDHFTESEHLSNFNFYEPRTVHESSLSPCVHSILASKLGLEDKAYEMYLRTSRLDLDDYNNDTEDGCHITSMAGTWLAIVKGFGGQRIKEDKISFVPSLPKRWESLSFKIKFRANLLEVNMTKIKTEIKNLNGPEINILINGEPQTII